MRIAPFQKMRLWLVGLGCLLGLLSVFFTQFNKAQAQGAKEKTLVTVPVIVTDKGDSYVTELKQEDFTVYEDSVKQQIASFAPVKSPVNVVLLLGTGDYSSEKVKSIQRSAIEFLEFVEYSDRIKVISFDSQVRELCDFTSSQAVLRKAITSAETGRGAKLYEAFKLALKSLEPLKGHKAIVFFTDGVDMNSAASSYEENIRLLEESGVIVYPIRYESRADKERLARDQLAGNTRRSANDDDGSVSDSRNPTGRMPFPMPQRRYPDQYPNGTPRGDPLPQGRMPDNTGSTGRIPDDRFPDARNSGRSTSSPRTPSGETVKEAMDKLHSTGDAYLNELAAKSGGEVYRADNLTLLPEAFARVSSELRNQYLISYYSTHESLPGQFRKIQIKVSQKDTLVRTRPGYRIPTIK